MVYHCVKVQGVDFTTTKKENILEEIKKYLKKVQSSKFKVQKKEIKPLIIFTPNPEIVTFAVKNPLFRKIVNSAQIKIPDGAGIVWALKKLHNLTVERISGMDLMMDLCEMAGQQRVTIGLIGGRDRIALDTAECLRVKQQNVKTIVLPAPEIGIRNSTFAFKMYDPDGKEIDSNNYFKTLVEDIRRKEIAILFVALGFPKQEYFIEKLKVQSSKFKLKNPLVLMSVGGAFDYISGRIPRAPLWMRKRGLEWLYRLIREPWRLPRQIKGAEFFLKVLFHSNTSNPRL